LQKAKAMNTPNRFSKAEKLSHLRTQRQSGQSVKQYCIEHHISKQSFYLWRNKYATVLEEHPGSDFVSLKLEPAQQDKSLAVIAQVQHPNGCVISFYKGCSPLFLSRIVKQL
jgi:transposase-like protein